MADPPLTLAQQLAICQQVARLVRARLPIPGELRRLADQAPAALAASTLAVDEQLAAGKSLTAALAGDDSRDSRMLSACIATGERSGQLDRTLEQWTALHLDCQRYERNLRVAMLYPLLLIVVTLLSLGYVIWQLIPEYRTTYALFSAQLPGWLELLVQVRERVGLLLGLLGVAALLPLLMWYAHRRRLRPDGLPREAAPRLRVQSLAAALSVSGVEAGLPLRQLLPLCILASGGSEGEAESGWGNMQRQQAIPLLGRETSLLLTSLHAGLLSAEEAAEHLTSLAEHLRQQAELTAARAARWLPMLVALTVGLLTILTYVGLIYLPWVLLLQRIVQVDLPAAGR
ncbi:MAG: type II secretion system F family protein [Planctomycetales bacterium]|nr:type II secretion system F family protein [Planctomycetales bacterium]